MRRLLMPLSSDESLNPRSPASNPIRISMATATASLEEHQAAEALADKNWRPKANVWAIALTVTLATFMEVLDSSIANVALPHIAGSLGASQDEATWVLTSYLVSNAVILPASAYLTTFIGRKKFYMICVVPLRYQFDALRPRSFAANPHLLPRASGRGWWWSRAIRTGDSCRHLYSRTARASLRSLWAGSGLRTRHRTHARRMDHRQLQLALDLLHQRAYRTDLSLPDQSPGRRTQPHIAKEVAESKKGGLKLDLFGFGLLAAGFGSLEFILDKGQEDDWFGSSTIVFFTILCCQRSGHAHLLGTLPTKDFRIDPSSISRSSSAKRLRFPSC